MAIDRKWSGKQTMSSAALHNNEIQIILKEVNQNGTKRRKRNNAEFSANFGAFNATTHSTREGKEKEVHTHTPTALSVVIKCWMAYGDKLDVSNIRIERAGTTARRQVTNNLCAICQVFHVIFEDTVDCNRFYWDRVRSARAHVVKTKIKGTKLALRTAMDLFCVLHWFTYEN